MNVLESKAKEGFTLHIHCSTPCTAGSMLQQVNLARGMDAKKQATKQDEAKRLLQSFAKRQLGLGTAQFHGCMMGCSPGDLEQGFVGKTDTRSRGDLILTLNPFAIPPMATCENVFDKGQNPSLPT
eukprot:3134117-Amphidinium_carterae.3